MLIFEESGRLGNQLFQYAALKTICQQNEKLILLGFEALQSAFNGVEAKIINSYSLKRERSFYYRLYSYADLLSERKIFARIKESKILPKLDWGSSWLNQIKFIEKSYFQSQLFFQPQIVKTLSLKPELLAAAKQQLSLLAQKRTPVFVHIRRGDYLIWPDRANPAILPASYYHRSIEIIQSKVFQPFFIFTSDDPFYVKDVFSNLENAYVSQGSALEDFALMTQCKGGILSASSFSWWAAYFAEQAKSDLFLAPKYWAGHRRKTWYPVFIESDFLTYIDV